MRISYWILLFCFCIVIPSIFCSKDKKSPTESTNIIHEIHNITFVTIPGGTFKMGDIENSGWPDEKPVHTVTLDSFEMSAYEITNAQFASYLNEALTSGDIKVTSSIVRGAAGDYNGQFYFDIDDSDCEISYSDSIFTVESGKENLPVIEVKWYGAKSFAIYYGCDLPTEAEWEYAARGGKQYKYGTNDGTINSSNVNYNRNVSHTTDVGSYPPNPFGLYDISGNVWEWCHDWYEPYSADSQTNPSGPAFGSERLWRGGSRLNPANGCRSAFRNYTGPTFSHDALGFRIVRRAGVNIY